MKDYKLVFVFLLLLFACASYGVKTHPEQTELVSSGPVKGLKLIATIGDTELGSSLLYFPTGIAIDFLGNLYISDTGNDRIVKCSTEGKFITETGGFGSESGEFNRPTYVATDNGLNVYVVDTQNKRIQRLDYNLNFIFTIQIQEEEDFPGFGLLEGIALSPSGEIFVSDIEGDCVIELNSFYEHERTFGEWGREGGLLNPLGVSISPRGEVYVADSQNDRVAVFDVFGNFQNSFWEDTLNNPAGVTVGPDNYVYVANTGNNSLAIFDPEGNLILEYGNEEMEMMKLSRPTDLKLGKDGKLYVVDSGNNRIQVFEVLR